MRQTSSASFPRANVCCVPASSRRPETTGSTVVASGPRGRPVASPSSAPRTDSACHVRSCVRDCSVAGLDADDVVRTGLAQVVEVRRVNAEGVLDDDHGQVGMLLAKAFQPAAGGIAFAIVLGVAVLVDDDQRMYDQRMYHPPACSPDAEGSNRVYRGGGWDYSAWRCRSADRSCRSLLA